MKTVLLAINGDSPTDSTFQYAIGLCRRIRADLNILQFVKGKNLVHCIASTRQRVGAINRFMEDSFAGAAFAEHGLPEISDEIMSGISDPLKKLLQSDHPDIFCTVALSLGNPATELSPYVDKHRKIVLTIFDPSTGEKSQSMRSTAMVKLLKKQLCVPLVVLKT